MNLPYGGALHQSDTRYQAHEAIKPHKTLLQAMVTKALITHGPCTCDRLEVVLEMSHQTVSARVSELRNAGVIEDTGKRARTRLGRTAVVWRVK